MIGARRAIAGAFGLALMLAAATGRADDAQVQEAKAHFDAGVALLTDPEGARYEEAYGHFKQSFTLSGSPTVLGNLGLCAMKLERDGEAIDSYTRYLAEVTDINPDERAQIERDLETLRLSAVKVEIVVEGLKKSGKEVSLVDTRHPVVGATFRNVYPLTSAAAHLLLRPGRHRLVLLVGEVEGQGWDFDATPGATLSHTFAIAPETKSPRVAPSRSVVGPAIVISLGAAGLVAGAILGGLTLSKVSELEDACPNGDCRQPGAQDDIDTAHAFVRATDFTLLGGGVVTAAGTAWLLWALLDKPSPKTTSWFAFGMFDGKRGSMSLGTAF